MDIFTVIYFAAILIEIIIRTPINQRRKQEKMSEQRVTTLERVLLGLLLLVMFFVPLIYAATHWLDFANYNLPGWAVGWVS